MDFISTRNARRTVSGIRAVVEGLSEEGGLFVPAFFPSVDGAEMEKMLDMTYPQRAAFIIGKYLPELAGELDSYTDKAYSRFDGDAAPLVKLDDSLFMLELWHGPTHAFKDIALTLLPYLLTGSKKLLGEKERTLILVATSGDTGKAALEGFKDVPGTDVIVFYPGDGVSALQKLQMMTQTGGNVYVAGINGNFDDAQTAVKKIFTDGAVHKELEKNGYKLSSANSINFGRLVPQIAYYFSSYLDMVDGGEIEMDEKINFCVPSGNFGNILAGYYAKRMGLPVGRLICASNKNNVLTDFIRGGAYSADRQFYKTTSPSMDILISSNLERLLFELSGRNDKLTAARMAELKDKGAYSISVEELGLLKSEFWADWSDENEIKETLCDYFEGYGYIADTHTSVALSVFDKYYDETGDDTKTVVVSTASPYKFAADVLDALGEEPCSDELKSLRKLEDITALPLPESLSSLPKLKKIYTDIIDKDAASDAVTGYARAARLKD